MGLWQAIKGAAGGALADQWLEVLEASNMGQDVLLTKGVKVRPNDPRNSNVKGTADVVSDGSTIHVYDAQAMMLVDGGAIVDVTMEPGYYTVKNDHAPSIMSGNAGSISASIKNSFERFKYSGVTPYKQQAFFVNLQEVKGIRFGTQQPIQYFDNFYNAELFLRCFGSYSIKIKDPILFYKEAVPRDASHVTVEMINEQFYNEFMEALQAAINQMSADGIRVSQVSSKMRELSKYMSDILDEDWLKLRGIEVVSVGIQSVSYDEKSRELIDLRNQGAMLSDAGIRQGYVQGSIARGIENAGKNEAGAGAAFMGVGMGMNAAGGAMAGFAQADAVQMERERLMAQQAQAPVSQQPQAGAWQCPNCQMQNQGKFCAECGTPKPEAAQGGFCTNCGRKFEGERPKFCPDCGQKQ